MSVTIRSVFFVGLLVVLLSSCTLPAAAATGSPAAADAADAADRESTIHRPAHSGAPDSESVWLEFGWLDLGDEARVHPAPRLATFPPAGFSEPIHQILMLIALAGIALSLQSL